MEPTHRDDDSLEVVESLSRKAILISSLHRLSNNRKHGWNESLKERNVFLILEVEVLDDLPESTASEERETERSDIASYFPKQGRERALTSSSES